MANGSSSSSTLLSPPKGLYTLSTTALLLLFFFSLFYFSRLSLEPKLTFYRDLFSESHVATTRLSPQTSGDAQFQDPHNESNPTPKPVVSIQDFNIIDKQPTPTFPIVVGGEAADSKVTEEASVETVVPSISDSEETSYAATEERRWADGAQGCDFYKGTWVKDEGHPIYSPKSCPYVDEAFDCQLNGRPDSHYLKWKWKPDGCNLPRLVSFHNRVEWTALYFNFPKLYDHSWLCLLFFSVSLKLLL